ncbi:MAG: ABC transporter permease [Anaerolineae bacterium]
MLRKILTLAWREIYVTYSDRTAILIMVLTPLALSTIIGMAFSGFLGAGSDVPVSNIPLAIVNLDEGADQNGETFNNGQIFVDLLVPQNGQTDDDSPLFRLTDAAQVADAETARAGVENGTYSAAIIIPAEFSRSLAISQTDQTLDPVTIQIYANASAPISTSIIRSVVTGITNEIVAGNIAAASTISALVDRAQSNPAFGLAFLASTGSGSFNPNFQAAINDHANPIAIDQQTVSGEVVGFNPLVTLGSAQAVFFMTFTAIGGVTSLLDDRKDGTLQRLIMTPTPRWVILLGKIVGVFVSCVVQVTLLVLALALVGVLLQGQARFIWGNNIPGLIGVILAVALAASGIGALVAGIVRTVEQANVATTIISIVFGILGGAFFQVNAISFLAPLINLTPNHWAVDAFTKLSQHNNDIGLNLVVLVVMGAVFYGIGVFFTNRRLEF